MDTPLFVCYSFMLRKVLLSFPDYICSKFLFEFYETIVFVGIKRNFRFV